MQLNIKENTLDVFFGSSYSSSELETINNKIDNLIENNKPIINIDLSKIVVIDSLLIGAFIKYFKKVSAQNGKLVINKLSEQSLNVLQDANLDKIFEIHKNEQEETTIEETVKIIDSDSDADSEIKITFPIDKFAVLALNHNILNDVISDDLLIKFKEIDADISAFIIDLTNIKFINSYTVGNLMKIHKETAERGLYYSLIAPGAILKQILENLGIPLILDIHDNIEMAISKYKKDYNG